MRPSYSRHLKGRRRVGAAVPLDWSVPYASPHGPIKNQQQSDACGGMAGSYFIEIQRTLQGVSEGSVSAKSVYAPIAYPGGGTEPDDLETQLAARGGDLEAQVPDLAADGSCTEAFMSDREWETPQLAADALTRAGYTPMSVAIDIDSIAEAIRNEGAVIWVIQGQNGQNPGWLSPYPAPPSTSNQNGIWEHFQASFGFRAVGGVKQVDTLNSWGVGVGDSGVQHFTGAYIDSGYIVDCFTLVHDSKLVPVQSPGQSVATQVWQAVCLYFRGVWGMPEFSTGS